VLRLAGAAVGSPRRSGEHQRKSVECKAFGKLRRSRAFRHRDAFDQGSDEAQERLLLRIVRPATEEGADIDIGHPTA